MAYENPYTALLDAAPAPAPAAPEANPYHALVQEDVRQERQRLDTVLEQVLPRNPDQQAQARQLVSQEAVYAEAKSQANEMVRAAQDKIKELKQVTNDYVDDSLRRTEEAVAESLAEIRESRSKFRALVNPQQRQASNSSPIIEDV